MSPNDERDAMLMPSRSIAEFEDPDGITPPPATPPCYAARSLLQAPPASLAIQAVAREDVALQAQLLVLTAKPEQFLFLDYRQAAVVGHRLDGGAVLPIGDRNPVPDRLSRRLELASQVDRIAPRADQIDHLPPELRRIGETCFRHR